MEQPSWKAGFDKTPKFMDEFELDIESTALLLIDMQYSNAHPDYYTGKYLKEMYPDSASYYFSRLSELVVPNQVKLLDFFRKNGLRVIYLTVGPNLSDYSDYKRSHSRSAGDTYGIRRFQARVGTFEHGILEELKPQEGELVINKTSAGAFTSTGIDQMLRNMDVTCLVIAGVVTHACVEMTARGAADRGYLCVLVDDACATYTHELHNGTVRCFATVSGKVQSTGEIIADLQRQLVGAGKL